MSMRRLKWLQEDLFDLFEEIRKEIPACHALSFSITRHNPGNVEMNIFYHEGNGCRILPIEKLFATYKEHQILYQKFEGWSINEVDK